ncbi:hypothetical protein QOZ80_9AG0689460 [Eleusine coracana subsp. coracana]|nr:hypothetical protein QOZ80_9AG0689460 [Eleusine coracana subsp. coracana]
MVISGCWMSKENFNIYFPLFYNGIQEDKRVWFPYEDLEFENPSIFRPDNPLQDRESTLIFEGCIRPGILPIDFHGGQCRTRSYEFYNPTTISCQLGFGRLPAGSFYIGRLWAREELKSLLEYKKVYDMASEIPLGNPADIQLIPSNSAMFKSWWKEWKKHLFCNQLNNHLIDVEDTVRFLHLTSI